MFGNNENELCLLDVFDADSGINTGVAHEGTELVNRQLTTD